MKKLLLLLLISTVGFTQSTAETEQELKNIIIDSFDEIWSNLDASSISKYYTHDFILLENGEVWNNDSIANYTATAKFRTPVPKRENSFDFIEIKVSGNSAWLAYQNYATFTTEDNVSKAHWLESATAIKTEDGWKLQMLHSTWVNDN